MIYMRNIEGKMTEKQKETLLEVKKELQGYYDAGFKAGQGELKEMLDKLPNGAKQIAQNENTALLSISKSLESIAKNLEKIIIKYERT